MEGAEHRLQRRILAPAFNQQAIKNLAPIFFRKAEEICEYWKAAISPTVKLEDDGDQSCAARIDVAKWIMRGSFDVVGLAVLNYDFHALQDESEEVYSAYRRMFNIADKGLNLWGVLELYFPILRKIFVSNSLGSFFQC
jgi:cytochrome P450